MSPLKVDRILVALKINFCQLQKLTESITSFRCWIALKATGMLTLKVGRSLVALKHMVGSNDNSQCSEKSAKTLKATTNKVLDSNN